MGIHCARKTLWDDWLTKNKRDTMLCWGEGRSICVYIHVCVCIAGNNNDHKFKKEG